MKKRWLLGGLACLMALSLVACGGEKADEKAMPEVESESMETETAAPETEAPKKTNYELGEVWEVPGQWSMVITDVVEVEERNWYAETYPDAVYIVDYYYTNDGYESPDGKDLQILIDTEVTDVNGNEGYDYPGTISYTPQPAPIGALCHAQACIGVPYRGTFKLGVEVTDHQGKAQKVNFTLNPDAPKKNVDIPTPKVDVSDDALGLDECWEVPGQWKLTITDIKEISDRIEYETSKPEAVYVIDYIYENLGYQNEDYGGLYFSLAESIVDAKGMMGYEYGIKTDYVAEAIDEDVTCTAQVCIGVNNKGPFVIHVSKADSNGKGHHQAFLIDAN